MLCIRVVTLITAFGIAIVKANLVVQKLAEQNWPELAMVMGNERHREQIQQAILALRPLPRPRRALIASRGTHTLC